jgi:hypothetical protein
VHGDRGPDRGESVAADPPDGLTWSVRPCARNPLLAGVVVAFVLVLSLAVQVLLHSPWWGALALLLLGLSVAPYYVGATYRLSEEGAAVVGLFGTHRRLWAEVRGCFPDAEGVLLSPLATPTRLAYTRGLYLRFADNRDEVLTRVEAFVEQAAGESRAAAPGD